MCVPPWDLEGEFWTWFPNLILQVWAEGDSSTCRWRNCKIWPTLVLVQNSQNKQHCSSTIDNKISDLIFPVDEKHSGHGSKNITTLPQEMSRNRNPAVDSGDSSNSMNTQEADSLEPRLKQAWMTRPHAFLITEWCKFSSVNSVHYGSLDPANSLARELCIKYWIDDNSIDSQGRNKGRSQSKCPEDWWAFFCAIETTRRKTIHQRALPFS